MLKVKSHILPIDIHPCLFKILFPDIFEGICHFFEQDVIFGQKLPGEFDTFALDELEMHLLNGLHMLDFEIVVILQVLFDFLGSADQLKVNHGQFWSHEFKTFVNGLWQQV